MDSKRIVGGRLVLVLLVIVIALILFYGLSVWLEWRVLQSMYEKKAGVDWFDTVFYHNYTFIVAALLSLLFINPRLGRSDLWEAYDASQYSFAAAQAGRDVRLGSFKCGLAVWLFWQLIKCGAAFLFIMPANGLPMFGNLSIVLLMLTKGMGSWDQVLRVFTLPIAPASTTELKLLIPTMEVQYRIVFYAGACILTVAAIRMFLKFIRDFVSLRQTSWVRDLFIGLSFVVLIILLGAPYWSMDVRTPYEYLIVATLSFCFMFIGLTFHFGGMRTSVALGRRKRAVLTIMGLFMLIILLGNAAMVLGFNVNWNNNWTEYEWKSMTEKQIAITSWAAGTEAIGHQPLSAVPSGNVTLTLSHVRQWDQEAAYTKMKNQIGVNWMRLSTSDIVYYKSREYWVAPTTVLYPSTDWISRRLIYTHTSKILAIESHSGEFVPVTEAFGLKSEPLIYYGEAFSERVYVNVKGFNEIEGVSYKGEPDYVLSGWQRSLWFLSDGQLGFAFSSPQEAIPMLYKRDVDQRVQGVLISGLAMDRDSYLVSDGQTLYYAAQVYVDYSLHTGFAGSRYKRLFAIVLVNIEDGRLQGYTVGDPSDGFLLDFYRTYYPQWGRKVPSWLAGQLRYPEQLLGAHGAPGQLDVDFVYHVRDSFIWRSGSDFYERPSKTMVHYILMASSEEKLKYVGVQLAEYKASSGRNLAGLYAAYGGEDLGKIALYRVSNATATQLIGPSAALQALETDDYVRTQLTLLTNRRLGNILLYSIADRLYYFIPVYIVTQEANAVITKIAFVVIVDAMTGAKVAAGQDASQAYYGLGGARPPAEIGTDARLKKLMSYVQASGGGYRTVNVTRINANAEVEVGRSTYLQEREWGQVKNQFDALVADYGAKTSAKEIYTWNADQNTLNLGILINQDGIVKLYYIAIKFR